MVNRISNHHSDLIFLVVRVPRNWQPRNLYDIPMRGEIMSSGLSALNFRMSRFAIASGLLQWAVMEFAGEEV